MSLCCDSNTGKCCLCISVVIQQTGQVGLGVKHEPIRGCLVGGENLLQRLLCLARGHCCCSGLTGGNNLAGCDGFCTCRMQWLWWYWPGRGVLQWFFIHWCSLFHQYLHPLEVFHCWGGHGEILVGLYGEWPLGLDCLKFNIEGICGSCCGTLPIVGEVVRAIDLGNRAGISHSDIVGSWRLNSIMVIGLPAPYIELQVATGFSTVTYVLFMDFCLY